MNPGKIIWLNGTSSAGKTTVAKSLQKIMGVPYLRTGGDHWQAAYPPGLRVITDDLDDEFYGWRAYYGPEGLSEVRLGSVGRQIFEGVYRATIGMADGGVNLILEDVIWDEGVFRQAITLLQPYPVWFVALDLSMAAAEQREQTRGDRGLGGARYFHERVSLINDVYDFRINTEEHEPEACAQQIKNGRGH